MLAPLPRECLVTQFDDDHAIAFAGLIQTATLARQMGLRQLLDERVCLAGTPGGANAGHKAMTLIHSALAGGECIDDAEALRAGATQAVLGHEVRAPSTLGTFLRSFTWGHVRQLDWVAGKALTRAWAAGARPGKPTEAITIDLDSTLCETYGAKKQGTKVAYTGVHGYNPLLASVAESGEVVHARLRGGNSHSSRGAANFLAETFSRVRAAGESGPLIMRADSGFYTKSVVEACRRADVRFSITVRLQRNASQVIEAIPEEAWKAIPYWQDGCAAVAETTYKPFGQKRDVRLIALRVQPPKGSQLALFARYSYHAFITDREGDTLELEADHRRHAEVENVIRDLKYGVGLNHLPSGRFAANAAWLVLNVIAHNLARWAVRIGLPAEPRLTTRTLRRRLLCLPGRLTHSARKWTLHLPSYWPWQEAFQAMLHRLRAMPKPSLD
jgi:hypothetical protein